MISADGGGLGKAGPAGSVVVTVGCAAVGLVAGAAAKVADLVPGGAISSVASGLAVWVLLLAVIARLSSRPLRAAVRAAGFFLAMVVAYYAVTVLVLHYLVDPRLVTVWGAAAVIACPAVAAGLQWAFRSRGLGAAVPIGVVAGGVIIDGATQRVLLAAEQPELAAGSRPLAAALEVVTALVVVAALPRTLRVRLVAAGVAVFTALVLLPVLERLVYGSGLFA